MVPLSMLGLGDWRVCRCRVCSNLDGLVSCLPLWFSCRGHLHRFMAVFARKTLEILPGITDYQLIRASEARVFLRKGCRVICLGSFVC